MLMLEKSKWFLLGSLNLQHHYTYHIYFMLLYTFLDYIIHQMITWVEYESYLY